MPHTTTASSASLNAVMADGFNKGESDDAKAKRREASLANVRAACEADGLSQKMTDEIVGDLQRAFLTADTARSITALFGGGK